MKSLQLTGIGLRSQHYSDFLTQKPPVAWLEVHSENYFGEGGKALQTLEKIRLDYPVSIHGVSLSLGSCDELNWQHLKQLRDLILRIKPCLVSDHLSWSSINGQYLHDLLPLPQTQEVIQHTVARIQQVQEYLNRQILIENISSYIQFQVSEFSEAEFLAEIAKQSGCGILLDINNVYVNSINLGFNAQEYIYALPKNLIQEIHLAGFISNTINEKEILIDSHNQKVSPAVWELYKNSIQHLGVKPTIIEWDADIPSLETLYLEAFQAETILRETYVTTKFAS